MSQKRGFFPDVSLPKPIFSEKPRFLASVLWYKTCCHSQIFTGGFCTKLIHQRRSFFLQPARKKQNSPLIDLRVLPIKPLLLACKSDKTALLCSGAYLRGFPWTSSSRNRKSGPESAAW